MCSIWNIGQKKRKEKIIDSLKSTDRQVHLKEKAKQIKIRKPNGRT